MTDQSELLNRLAALEARVQELESASASAVEPTRVGRSTRRAWLRQAATAGVVGLAGAFGARSAHGQAKPPGGKDQRVDGQPMLIGGTHYANTDTYLSNLVLATPTVPLWHTDQTPSQTGITIPFGSNARVTSLATDNYNNTPGKVGIAQWAYALDGTGLLAHGRWPIQLFPLTVKPPVATAGGDPNGKGHLYYEDGVGGADAPAALWTSHVVGGGWQRISALGDSGVMMPITPVRVLNTGFANQVVGFDGATGNALPNTPNPLSSGQTRSYRIGGKTFGGVAFPTGILGVLFNVTITHGVGVGGFVVVYGGNPATVPSIASVNPSGVGGITGNFGFAKLVPSGGGTGAMNLNVNNVGSTVHVIIDVMAYFL